MDSRGAIPAVFQKLLEHHGNWGWMGLAAPWSGGNVETEPGRGRGLNITRNELRAPFQPQSMPGLWELWELCAEEAPSAMEDGQHSLSFSTFQPHPPAGAESFGILINQSLSLWTSREALGLLPWPCTSRGGEEGARILPQSSLEWEFFPQELPSEPGAPPRFLFPRQKTAIKA